MKIASPGCLYEAPTAWFKVFLVLALAVLPASCGSSSATGTTTTTLESEITYLASCSGGDGRNGLVKPSEIYFHLLPPCIANGVGDKIEISTWTTWSVDVATGVGRFGVNTYQSSGADENYDFYDITITLDTPIDGFFSRMHLSWTVRPPTALESYEVKPMTYKEYQLLYGPEADCESEIGWTYNDSLPLVYCNAGRGVAYVQSALGLENNGYFGAETWTALGKFQLANGLTEFLYVGPETWLKLYPSQGGPGNDINDDGLVTADEFGE